MKVKVLREIAVQNIRNMTGCRTNRKIVVIESDDWGSIRMPSLQVFKKLERAGLNLVGKDAKRYNLNDTLATANDLEKLFEVIISVKDCVGRNAVFTPVTLVANPDFGKIKDSGFNEYYYEPFTDTLKRYPGCEKSFDLWKEGITSGIFVPQLHGREHLNVIAWLNALRNQDPQTMSAFDEGMWGFVPGGDLLQGVDLQAAFLPFDLSEIEYHKEIIKEATDLFETLFGYRAEYFVPPNGIFHNSLNMTLVKNGIKYRSVRKLQTQPLGNGKHKKIIHWHGQQHSSGIRYLTRNSMFEPNHPGRDWVDSCMNSIKIAFRWQKPAIITTHRVNYIGALNPENRDKGLYQLKVLLKEITKNWPDAEFMTTAEMSQLMFDPR